MGKDNNVIALESFDNSHDMVTELVRQGARQLIAEAIDLEFIEASGNLTDSEEEHNDIEFSMRDIS